MIGTMINLDDGEEEGPYLLVTDRWYLLKDWDCLIQTKRNAIEAKEDRCSGFFFDLVWIRDYIYVGLS